MASVDSKTWVIGAAADCDLVVDAPTVSGRHCRLTLRDGKWLLDDLDSTNGTHVNGRRISQSTSVERSDRITLGKSAVMPWPDFVNGGSVGTVAKGGKNSIAVVAAVAIVLFAILAVVVWRGRGEDDVETKEPSRPNAKSKIAGPAAKTKNQTGRVQPSQSLFVILVGTKDQSLTMRLGTAFAVSPKHLVTTAEIVNSVRKLEDKYPVVSVYCPATEQQIAINLSMAQLHPKIVPMFREEQELKRKIAVIRVQIDEILDRLDQNVGEEKQPESGKNKSKEPTEKASRKDADALKKFGNELAGLDSRFANLKESQRFYDLAVLEVATELKHRLPFVKTDAKLFANLPVTIHGISFPTTQFASLDRNTLRPARLAAEIRQLPRDETSDRKTDRLVVQTASVRIPSTENDQPAEYQWWVGSPVLNSDGQIIGIYSRLTPALKPDEPPSGQYHDITRIGGLRDISSEILSAPTQQQPQSSQ